MNIMPGSHRSASKERPAPTNRCATTIDTEQLNCAERCRSAIGGKNGFSSGKKVLRCVKTTKNGGGSVLHCLCDEINAPKWAYSGAITAQTILAGIPAGSAEPKSHQSVSHHCVSGGRCVKSNGQNIFSHAPVCARVCMSVSVCVRLCVLYGFLL